MRYAIIAVALVAAATAAEAQTTQWQFYQDAQATNGLLQAFVRAPDGSQLILKCDAAGKGSVVAAIHSPMKLGRPGARAVVRPITLRFDEGAPVHGEWRYYEQTAMAYNTTREHTIKDLLLHLGDAKKLGVIFEPLDGTPITTSFDVEGAGDAIKQVFESCKDTVPS